jgi:hypothetical protein
MRFDTPTPTADRRDRPCPRPRGLPRPRSRARFPHTPAAAAFTAMIALALAVPAAGAQVPIGPGPSPDGSPRDCIDVHLQQGLALEEALRECMRGLSSAPGEALDGLIGPGAPALSETSSCNARATPFGAANGDAPPPSGGDGDGLNGTEMWGEEIVVTGQLEGDKSGVRALTREERAALKDAADAFPLVGEEAGWTDFAMWRVWDTAAKKAKERAKASGNPTDIAQANRLTGFSLMVMAAAFGKLVNVPAIWDKQMVLGIVNLIREGPTPANVAGLRDRVDPNAPGACAMAAAVVEIIRHCDGRGWATPECQKLRHCPTTDVTDPAPDGEIACGDPDIDTAALAAAGLARCHMYIKPVPGEDPCARSVGSVIVVADPGYSDACKDPAAQPLQDGCVKISVAHPTTIRIAGVLATGLERLGGPIVVLPEPGGGPPRPRRLR